MSSTTQCPTCNTRFKVSEEQLATHQGLVRCGRCQAVFNATDFLQDDQPSPQLDLPISAAPAVAEATAEQAEAAAAPAEHEPSLAEEARYEWHDPEQVDEPPPVTLAQTVTMETGISAPPPAPAAKAPQWPWVVGSGVMLLVLLAQGLYFFRVEIAARSPGLKPALVSVCRLFGCSVPLPRKADLMSIESSYLEADPVQANVISLNALLRNHASYTQAYPQIELTLTDDKDLPLARRSFRPAEYLKSPGDEEQGLAPYRELGIRLNLDTADLKPAGYRLLLYYP